METIGSGAHSSSGMADASICGLGQAAGNPIKCLIRYFPELFDG